MIVYRLLTVAFLSISNVDHIGGPGGRGVLAGAGSAARISLPGVLSAPPSR